MAKNRSTSKKKHETGTHITTPSAYGSHKSMVVDPESLNGVRELNENEVVCRDDTHYYITTKDRLDTGLADPNRYSNSKVTYVP